MGVTVPSPAGSTPMDTSQERTGTLLNQLTVTDATGTDFDVTSMATARLTIIPTSYSGTVTFYASADGTNFDVIRGYKQGTTTVATNVALSGSSTVTIWEFPVSGLKKLRVITSGSSSGTSIVIVGRASPLPSVEPIGVTLASAVLAAGSALVGGVNVVDSAGTNKAGVDAQHNVQVSDGGTASVVITASSAGAVKTAAGRLCRVLTTSTATSAVNIYDNTNAASGTIIATIPASTAVGTVFNPQAPASTGIYVGGGSGTPGLTVFYS